MAKKEEIVESLEAEKKALVIKNKSSKVKVKVKKEIKSNLSNKIVINKIKEYIKASQKVKKAASILPNRKVKNVTGQDSGYSKNTTKTLNEGGNNTVEDYKRLILMRTSPKSDKKFNNVSAEEYIKPKKSLRTTFSKYVNNTKTNSIEIKRRSVSPLSSEREQLVAKCFRRQYKQILKDLNITNSILSIDDISNLYFIA